MSRRSFLASTAAAGALVASGGLHAADEAVPEPIIDIHQHTNYHKRDDEQMLAHQRAMGITRSILLPAGREV
ncbi:MAG: twin-arginine translocation signal domain-containing protein, partial [Planctomycetales bacterium]|nr:twin-arginine translocation signal domain-containing protein [Planctomycetales bacterium]